MQFNLYIGSNNETGQVDQEIIIRWLTNAFDDFTVIPSIGYYKGKPEASMVVTIFTDQKDRFFMIEFIKGLAVVLKQESIGMQSVYSDGSNSLDWIMP